MFTGKGPTVFEEGVKEIVTCTICLETFADPHILSCGHSFCKTCLQSCRNATKTCNDKCAICRSISLQNSSYLNRALENMVKLAQESKLVPTPAPAPLPDLTVLIHVYDAIVRNAFELTLVNIPRATKMRELKQMVATKMNGEKYYDFPLFTDAGADDNDTLQDVYQTLFEYGRISKENTIRFTGCACLKSDHTITTVEEGIKTVKLTEHEVLVPVDYYYTKKITLRAPKSTTVRHLAFWFCRFDHFSACPLELRIIHQGRQLSDFETLGSLAPNETVYITRILRGS